MADIFVKGPHNTVIKYADQGDGTHAEVVSAVGGGGGEVAAADITDASATAVAFITADAATDMRIVIDAQEQGALLDDLVGLSGTVAQGDVFYYNGTDIVRLAAGTSGQFLKTLGAGANPAWDTLAGGGDLLSTNNLSDVDDAATALGNLGGAAATGGTMTTKTLAGITTISGTQLLSASAMGANEIDIAKARNTKTVPASNPTYTFSGSPASGQTWSLELIGDTAARVVTIPSTYDMQAQATVTTFIMPADGKATIYWQNDGSVNRAWGIPGATDNYEATAAPTVNDDVSLGYAVGSQWIDTTNDLEYVCVDATDGAAVWTVRGGGGPYRQTDYSPESAHTGTLDKTPIWTKAIPAGTLVEGKQMVVQTRLVRTGTTTAYTITVEFGGQTLVTQTVGSANAHSQYITYATGNATQVTPAGGASGPFTVAAPGATDTTVDGTAAQNVVVSVTLGDTGTSVVGHQLDIEIK